MLPSPALEFHWASPDRWSDVETIFGKNGACGGCWCMHWKLKKSLFEQTKGDGNKQLMRASVQNGDEPGIIAYDRGKPIAWCAVEPRSRYTTLTRFRILQPVDNLPVWSVVCFFILRPYRRKGISTQTLKAVTTMCAEKGAKIIEGYPTEPKRKVAAAFAWTGLAKSFTTAGFEEVARRSPKRPIMRYIIVNA
jgi:GNAT superfamily N-acetyltransferase